MSLLVGVIPWPDPTRPDLRIYLSNCAYFYHLISFPAGNVEKAMFCRISPARVQRRRKTRRPWSSRKSGLLSLPQNGERCSAVFLSFSDRPQNYCIFLLLLLLDCTALDFVATKQYSIAYVLPSPNPNSQKKAWAHNPPGFCLCRTERERSMYVRNKVLAIPRSELEKSDPGGFLYSVPTQRKWLHCESRRTEKSTDSFFSFSLFTLIFPRIYRVTQQTKNIYQKKPSKYLVGERNLNTFLSPFSFQSYHHPKHCEFKEEESTFFVICATWTPLRLTRSSKKCLKTK